MRTCGWCPLLISPLLPSTIISSDLQDFINIMEYATSSCQELSERCGIHTFGQAVCQLGGAMNPLDYYSFFGSTFADECLKHGSFFLTWPYGGLLNPVVQTLAVYYGICFWTLEKALFWVSTFHVDDKSRTSGFWPKSEGLPSHSCRFSWSTISKD